MKTVSLGVEVLLTICLTILPMSALAQSERPYWPPSGTGASSTLGEKEIRGEGLFLQRCGLCHMPKQLRWKSPVMVPSLGPSLSGLFKDAAPDKEAAVRQQILKGSTNMPGFQYALEPKELDDVIAYLKKI